MGFITWFCRCVPGFSVIAWISICYLALGSRFAPWNSISVSKGDLRSASRYGDFHHLTVWQMIYLFHSVLVHIFGCLIFPVRLAWAVWHIGAEVRGAQFEAADSILYAESETSEAFEKSSQSSLNVSESITPDEPLSRASTPKIPSFHDETNVVHAIILPSYKEDIDTLMETLSVLASHVLAKSSYDVYLAMEQRDVDAESTATQLLLSFSTAFRNISFSLHPGDIPGEVAGKSSNVSWAARQLSHNYIDTESRKNCVITVMDSDTHFSSTYFYLLSKFHGEHTEECATTLYVTPIIFDRNSQDVSPLVRVADIFWCGAGLSGLYNGSPICIPTSVYSVPMTLAGHVGGWDTGPESIGEDLHMYLKCYFATSGRFNIRILYSPASQSNVSSDAVGWRWTSGNIRARYKQAMRHMWGSLDTGYAIEKTLQAMWTKNHRKGSSWLSRADDPFDRVPNWITTSTRPSFTPPNIYAPHPTSTSTHPRPRFSKTKLLILFHRLFEAHFLPTHLTVALASGVLYSTYVPSSQTHPLLTTSFAFNGTLRFIGVLLTFFYLYLYESYHFICVRAREEEMKRAGLWKNMQGGFSYRNWRVNWVDYCLMPVAGMLFSTIPAVIAEVSHFWTDKLVYTVSRKPRLGVEVGKELVTLA